MKMFICHHQVQVSDSDTIDLLLFDRKLQSKKNNDTYGSLAAKIAHNDGVSENYITRVTVV